MVDVENGRRVGYIRVSSIDQNVARQRKSLRDVGCTVMYEEKISGATMKRPELQRMLDNLEQGDVVYVHEISRLSRSSKDLLEIVEQIKAKGASLKSISESWLDTTDQNPMTDFLLAIFSGLVEFERKMIRQRQKEGIEAAKQAGRYRGRKTELIDGGSEEMRLKAIVQAIKDGKTIREIRQIYRVGTGTIYNIITREGLR